MYISYTHLPGNKAILYHVYLLLLPAILLEKHPVKPFVDTFNMATLLLSS